MQPVSDQRKTESRTPMNFDIERKLDTSSTPRILEVTFDDTNYKFKKEIKTVKKEIKTVKKPPKIKIDIWDEDHN